MREYKLHRLAQRDHQQDPFKSLSDASHDAAPGSPSPACHACQAVLPARPTLPSVPSQEGDGVLAGDIVRNPVDITGARLTWQPVTYIKKFTTRSHFSHGRPRAPSGEVICTFSSGDFVGPCRSVRHLSFERRKLLRSFLESAFFIFHGSSSDSWSIVPQCQSLVLSYRDPFLEKTCCQ